MKQHINGKRADDHTVDARVCEVYSLLVNGYSTYEIVHNSALAEKWGVCLRQMSNYLSRARGLLEQEADRTRTSEIGKAIRRYEKMYRKMDAIGDYRGCLSAQARIDELLSLCLSKKIDITSNGAPIIPTEIASNIGAMSALELANIISDER